MTADAAYVLPLRWTDDSGLAELAAYLRGVVEWAEVLVVDGSPDELFAAHGAAFPPEVRHLRPTFACRNGKVAGVLTGLHSTACEYVVIADDDVRYDASTFGRVVELLREADVVRPQSYFLALPWHARWDTARSLLNRALASDYPGTLGVRRSTVMAAGGYDGDVLFENLELIRTVRAVGGVEVRADDVFVGRLPCSTQHFLRQRVRQAYDDFAQPSRLVIELSLLPALLLAARRRRAVFAYAALAAVLLAEIGRRRRKGWAVFGSTAALWAPAWVAERAVAVWLAVAYRVLGGMPYAGSRLAKAGNSQRVLKRMHRGARRTRSQKRHT